MQAMRTTVMGLATLCAAELGMAVLAGPALALVSPLPPAPSHIAVPVASAVAAPLVSAVPAPVRDAVAPVLGAVNQPAPTAPAGPGRCG